MERKNFKSMRKLFLLAAIPLIGLSIAMVSCMSEDDTELIGEAEKGLENVLNVSNEEVFDVVENMPSPPGGMEGWSRYLSENLTYPAEAKRKGVEGTVYVAFTITKEGIIIEPTILRGIGCGADEEAVRIIQAAPNWIPGEQRGEKVNVKMHVPIKFKLADGGLEKSPNESSGRKIDILLLDENHIRLNGKQIKTNELAKEISSTHGDDRIENGLITAVISGRENIKMGQISDVQGVLRNHGIRKISYLGSNAITPVLVF